MNSVAVRGLMRGLLLVGLLLLAGAIWLFATRPEAPPPDARAAYAKAIGGPFTLTDTNGRQFGSEQLRGKPFAIFFGFTRCPDVCPTSLSRMVKLRNQLGRGEDALNLVFVSVDPRTDTPAGIGQYLQLFNSPIIGLTGTQRELEPIKKAYGIYSAEVPQEGGEYLVDHTATVFLMGSNGEFVSTLDVHDNDQVALEKLGRVVG